MFNNQGNTYALKWTSESVSDVLMKIEHEAHQKEISYLSEALMNQHISARTWSYWKKKFVYHDDIIEQMAFIETIFEVKLFKTGLSGESNTAFAIFALKNNHGWTDRPVIEIVQQEHKHEGVIIELSETETIIVPALKK